MANENNLKPIRTESEAREKGKKGGKKSGEARRNKRLLKDYMEKLLEMPNRIEKHTEAMDFMGITKEDMDNKMALTVALYLKAVSGDVGAMKEIRNLIGEDESTNTEQLNKLDEVLDKIGGVI